MSNRKESWASDTATRRTMQSNRSRDTAFEVSVRSLLHRQGLRYRVHYHPVPDSRRSADIAFIGARVVVLLDGCFWHRCPEHFVMPKKNAEWWAQKINRNADRDIETERLFTQAGWTVLRFWEHEPASSIVEQVLSVIADHYGVPSATLDQGH